VGGAMIKKIWNWIFKRKPKRPQPRKNFATFFCGGGWGDRIEWSDWENRRVVGWKSPRPAKGDVLKATMESGKIAQFIFGEIEYCDDPSDMFFATMIDFAYL
jgi:hypothetical protein